jgi:phytoene dehydrogenase-like protein
MAITKTDAQVQHISVEGSVITATVNHAITDGSTSPATEVTRVRVDVVVSNATSGELTALQSLVSKAAVLAVA